MPIDKSYLALHGRTWRVQVAVPKQLRGVVGASVLFASTKTDSLSLANLRKHPLIHTLKARIKAAEGELRKQGKGQPDPLISEALEWKTALRDDEDEPGSGTEYALSVRLDEIEKAEGEARAAQLATIATGRGTPISALVDDYLREKAFRPRQAHEYRRTLRAFEGWLMEDAKLPGTVEAVTRRIVADWRRDTLIKPAVHHKTGNKTVSALSSFWRWLEVQGHVTGESPWRGMSLPKAKTNGQLNGTPSTTRSAEKRAFTDAELTALLTAPGTSPLLHEGSIVERSQPISKVFTRLRRKLAQVVPSLDQRTAGARQADVDWHTFRRTFAQKARDALSRGEGGFTAWTLAEVLGHAKSEMPLGMTMGVYAGREGLEAKAACVRAVKLPLVRKVG